MEFSALLGVTEVLELGDLEFSILLDDSENGDGFVFEVIAVDGMADARCLCHGSV